MLQNLACIWYIFTASNFMIMYYKQCFEFDDDD